MKKWIFLAIGLFILVLTIINITYTYEKKIKRLNKTINFQDSTINTTNKFLLSIKSNQELSSKADNNNHKLIANKSYQAGLRKGCNIVIDISNKYDFNDANLINLLIEKEELKAKMEYSLQIEKIFKQ